MSNENWLDKLLDELLGKGCKKERPLPNNGRTYPEDLLAMYDKENVLKFSSGLHITSKRKRETYLDLKQRKVRIQNKIADERANGVVSRSLLIEHSVICGRIRKIEKRWRRPVQTLLLILCLILGGCTTSATLGVSSSLYYPKKWESPASRKQHTQPTVGMARNNELPMVGDD